MPITAIIAMAQAASSLLTATGTFGVDSKLTKIVGAATEVVANFIEDYPVLKEGLGAQDQAALDSAYEQIKARDHDLTERLRQTPDDEV